MLLPPRTTVFRQRDFEDNMYVIVKGRVAFELESPDYGNMPIVIQTMGDGEAFGQLT